MSLMTRKACKILSAFLGTLFILAAIIAYSQYLTLKQTLLVRMSDKATSLIGQKTEIGNLTFTLAGGITIHDIIIRNPEGFGQGQLLNMKRVRLALRYSELFRGRFSFRSIEADSPELSLMTDNNGRLNISEAFRAFLAKKGTAHYQIDAFVIHKAAFSYNHNPLYTARDITVTLNTLSSDPGTKSSAKVSLTYLGKNSAAMDGWVFLKDTPGKFSVSLSSDTIDPSPFGKMLEPYGMDLEKIRGSITALAEGDIDKGIRLTAKILMKTAGFPFMKMDEKEISLHAEAFLEPARDSLLLKSAVFKDRDGSSLRIQGAIHDLLHNPSYMAEVKIDRLDLSLLTIMKNIKAGGILTSDLIRIKGRSFSSLPEAAGTASISNGTLSMDRAELQNIQTRVIFSSGKELSARAEASANVLKVGPYTFKEPVGITLSADGKGRPGNVSLSSRLSLPDIGLVLSGKDAHMQGVVLLFDGTVRQNIVLGKTSFGARDMDYDQYRLKNLKADFTMEYAAGQAILKDLSVESGMARAGADAVIIKLPQGKGKTLIEAKNLDASYPERKAALKGMNCTASLLTEKQDLSGNISFVAENVTFQDISAGSVEGKGSLEGAGFSLDIPDATLFNGAARLSVKGTVKEGPFPVSVDARADRIDLGQLAKAAGPFIPASYHASGEIQQLTFRGTILSSDSIAGTASLAGKNISVRNAENRTLLKDVSLHADALFREKDVDLKADASAGGLAATLSGAVNRFAAPDRSLHLDLIVPEVKAGDIRIAFWDIVPDRLLYAGLDGSISLNLNASYGNGAMKADGAAVLRDVTIEGENGEYSIGPISGMLPLHYDAAGETGASIILPSFDRSDFDRTNAFFREADRASGNEIRIGSIRYGFRLLDDISLWVEQKGRALNINRISAKMFGGNVYGTAQLNIADGLSYQAGLLLDSVSLTQLCEDITPIKGYISGKVNGIAMIKGKDAGLGKMIGKADFWTFSDQKEKMRISREFLQKIGGPQVRAYLGERRFDKGAMGLYIQNGFLVFRELEISNRNLLGIADLSVKVAPFNNRIAIDHFLWTIVEAAQRAKKE
jgi:hypothetical protein